MGSKVEAAKIQAETDRLQIESNERIRLKESEDHKEIELAKQKANQAFYEFEAKQLEYSSKFLNQSANGLNGLFDDKTSDRIPMVKA